VAQQVSRQLFNSSFLWIYSSWRPAWAFSGKSFNELFGFGSKLLLSGLLDTVYRNIYYVIIGRFYSTAQLGQYTRAEQFNSIFSSNLTSVVQRVSYPVLSSIQNEPERLKLAYQQLIKTTMLITFICMLGLAAVSKPLNLILIGEKWLEAAHLLPIICFTGMLYPLHAINLNILQVKGRSDLFLKLEIIKKIIAVAPILLGIVYGIEYMLWGSVGTSIVAYFLNSHYSGDLIHYSIREQLKDILPSFCTSGIIAFAIWSISLLDMNVYITFALQCISGVLLVMLIYERMKSKEYNEIKQMLFSIIKCISVVS
jgi:O-antigen/teichoic acid export membrane protein